MLDEALHDATSAAEANRRGRERKRVKADITLTPVGDLGETLGDPFTAHLWNLSTKGCGIRTRTRLTPGSHYMARFPKPGTPAGLQILAQVRHCRGNEQTGFVVGMSFELGRK